MAAMETINAEILALTYGSIVRQLVADYDDVEEVNKQLEKMGRNMGQRLVDEFLARSRTSSCSSHREVAETIAHAGFRMFLNANATVTGWAEGGQACTILLEDNPLTDHVELPDSLRGLRYCNLLCGVIVGALEMVNIEAECSFVQDALQGGTATELRLRFKSSGPEVYPCKDDD